MLPPRGRFLLKPVHVAMEVISQRAGEEFLMKAVLKRRIRKKNYDDEKFCTFTYMFDLF